MAEQTVFRGKDAEAWGSDYVLVVVHGSMTQAGTDWPIYSTVRRSQLPHEKRPSWVATFNLCNGLPTGARQYRTRREAEAAVLD